MNTYTIELKEPVVMDVKEKLSKAFASILDTGTAVIVTKDGKYYGIVDDRHVRLGIKDASSATLESSAVKAPTIEKSKLDDLEELVRKFLAGHFKALPVVDKKKRVVGLITRAEVMKYMVSKGLVPNVGVNTVMATPPYVIEENETFAKSKRLMKELKVHRLIVVNKGKLVGVVSTWDFLILRKYPNERQGLQLITEVKNADRLPIKMFIREPLVMIDQYEMLPYATKEMADKETSYAVVVDDRKRPVGLLSALDIFKMVLRVLSKRPEVFIIGLGPEELYYYEDAKSLIEKVLSRFAKSFNIGHATVYVKKGKSVYRGILRIEVEHIPLHLTAEHYELEVMFDMLVKELKRMLAKLKERLKNKKGMRTAVELFEEEEYI